MQPSKACEKCGQRCVLSMQVCGRCGNPFQNPVLTQPATQTTETNKRLDPAASVIGGGLVGCVAAIIGVLLCFTGIGAIIGIPLIIAGGILPLIAPFQKHHTLKGNCPYCGQALSVDIKMSGVTCAACRKRAVIRDKMFYRVE